MHKDLFTIKFDSNPSPWFNNYVELSFSKLKLQPVVNELVKECSEKDSRSSCSYDSIVNSIVKKSWNEDCGSMRPYLKALHHMIIDQKSKDNRLSSGHNAAAKSIYNKIAWMTPGFVKAKLYNDTYGG